MHNISADRAVGPTVRNYHEGRTPEPRPLTRQQTPYRQLVSAVRIDPGKTALITETETLTFAELLDLTDRLASGLVALGLQPGEAVATLLGNDWRMVPLFVAVARVGGVFMSGNRYLSAPEIDFQLGEAQPRIIVGDRGVSVEAVLAAATPDQAPPFHDEHAPFSIRFSSGTTGRPKMMIASQRAQAAQYPMLSSEMHLIDRDVHYSTGSLAHAALIFVFAQLFVGGTVVIREKFDLDRFWEDCVHFGATNTMVVPTMVSALMTKEGEAPALRAMVSCGASLRVDLKERLLSRFPNLGLFEMYGSAEFGMVTSLRPHEQLAKPASVGRAYFGSDIALFDDEGQPVPTGTIGNLYSRGITLIDAVVGSVRPSPIPAHLAEEGWRTCGDLAWFDEDGYLFISDRRVDLILSGAFNVYPAEVEAVLCEMPGVINAAVVGVDDERWGQRVTAYVEGQASAEDLMARCREVLTRYKIPQAIHFVDELPRTPTGKISRTLVRDAVRNGTFPGRTEAD